MRAILHQDILPAGDLAEAAAILRACVHCGFCNATCPSYQVLGDERDGPRGRIYLMKHLLEGGDVTTTTQTHLDRCLGCRACETTCPSGVHYTRLLELVRPHVEQVVPRAFRARFTRWLLRKIVPYPARFGRLLAMGRVVRRVLPRKLRELVPSISRAKFATAEVAAPRARYVLLEGCVQDTAAPQINLAAAQILSSLQITTQRAPQAGCCGALALHLGATEEARDCARRNIDAWSPLLTSGEYAGVFCASSGCTQVLKDYGHLLRDDPRYAARASDLAAAVRDASEVITAPEIAALCAKEPGHQTTTIAFQAPCSLQHGLHGNLKVSELLRAAGYQLSAVADGHLCCGSAGSYSLLQPAIAGELRARKLAALEAGHPQAIATANIGCLLYLQQAAQMPVKHWLELVAEAMPAPGTAAGG
jgi:glycolate oxidase iron-sulfur subunit